MSALENASTLRDMPLKAHEDGIGFRQDVGKRLEALRKSKRLSPEEVSRLAGERISASYIRRIEKGHNAVTIDALEACLEAMGVNLGLFFQYQLEESKSSDDRDRYYAQMLQRGLNSPKHRDSLIFFLKLIRSDLGEP